jgi:formylglycine-generating enzyme required for sulfatase activity/serine/threonine protein kinase
MGRPEVLKVVSSHLVKLPGVQDRFLAEIRNAAKLEHTNVVTAYTALRLGESIVFAMQYVEGLDLARLVAARGPLPVANACNYVHQAALGLQHAHEHGMVHRDIKPSNLMLARQGSRAVIKVLDFGLAKLRSEGPTDGTLTHEGQMLGTPDFIAPEQIRNARDADIRADIYSLGCTLYYLLTGAPPFKGTSLYDILQAHFSANAQPLNLARPDVPVELAALVGKMMAKEPERRFQEPKQVARALAPFFKKGVAALQSPGAKVPYPGQASVDRPVSGIVSAPIQPATHYDGPILRPRKAAERSGTETAWQSLIDFGETEESQPDPPAPAPARRPKWLWPTIAVCVLLLGLLVAWGVIVRIRTANGTVELANLPQDANVFVDGTEVVVNWPGGGKPALITVTPGKHKIVVKRDGVEVSGDEITLLAGGKEKLTARIVRPDELSKAAAQQGLQRPPGSDTRRPDQDRPKIDALESIENSVGMTLRLIPKGDFLMGSPNDAIEAETEERPPHQVRITRPFYMGVFEVTQAQYKAVMGNNPSHFSANGQGKDQVIGQSTDQHPVENVSWQDAILFCNKLSEKEARKPFYEINGKNVRVSEWNGQGYRLPTEAEWEYACRANATTRTRFSFGDNVSELREYAWFETNSDGRTHAVGQKRANQFGLHDMHGNVWEWCWDGFLAEYYKQSPPDDPAGPAGPAAAWRAARGGGFAHPERDCRSASRGKDPTGVWNERLGFRVAIGTTESSGLSTRSAAGTGASPASEKAGGGQMPASPVTNPDPLSYPESFVNKTGMKMKLIRAGEFSMGSRNDAIDAENDEKPLHRVRITKQFYMGACEVTQAQYEAVIGNNPSQFSPKGGGKDRVAGLPTGTFPVENVSFFDAIQFCNKLSEKEGKKPFYQIDGTDVRVPDWIGQGYRLPTEAEWEYSCRANAATRTLFSFGDSLSELGAYAWFDANSDGRTHEVGQKRPNSLGLYDVHGNVWEWCWDWHLADFYNQPPTDDPTGPPLAGCRLFRGGSWNERPRDCRSSRRWAYPPNERGGNIGIRVALGALEPRGPKPESAGGKGPSTATEKSGDGQGPATSAAGAAGTPDRAPSNKASPIGRQDGAARDSERAHSFRVATNGLGGTPFIDPITFGPDGLGFNNPGTALPWVTNDAFARITARGTLGYPTLPASRYVFEVELTVNRRCGVQFQLGDPLNSCHIDLRWNTDNNMIKCELRNWQHGGWSWSPNRDFVAGARTKLKLVVGDGRQTLFLEGAQDLTMDCWPTDCCLRIGAEPDSALIHRCFFRPLTEQDVAACGWPIQPARLPLDASGAKERLRRIFAGYPERPRDGKRFAVKTTGTPMAWIPSGTFEMGSREPKNDGRHLVRLTKGYWMAQIEVTQGAYKQVTGANPSRFTGSLYLPVDWVPWDEAEAYCRKVTELERAAHRLPDGYEYRLPTEAEWEYACRADSNDEFSVPPESVWSWDRSGVRPHEVAESQPNAWGLYDMHGNAMEWCFDAWDEYPKGKKVVTADPFKIGKPNKDTTFVVRGGAWWADSGACTSHWRSRNFNNANGFRGFRIALAPTIGKLDRIK